MIAQAPGGLFGRSILNFGAPAPITIEAVLATLASTQVAAATLAVRQCSAAGRPVEG